MERLRIGTRGSPLALAQAHMAASALCSAHGWDDSRIEIVPIRTTGDAVQDRPLADIGGKALWTKELDCALLDGRIDCSVHSMKDVETIRPDSLAIAAMLPRANSDDRLIGAATLGDLPPGARFGTSSPRRAAQMQMRRPDLTMVPLRGNVASRIAKVEAGEVDATLLAAAGLDRLGLDHIGVPIPGLLPAPSQGAVGIEIRSGDAAMRGIIGAIDDPETGRCVWAERALLAALGGTCHSAVAALARRHDVNWRLEAEILLPDGSEYVQGLADFADDGESAGRALARDLLGRASPALQGHFSP